MRLVGVGDRRNAFRVVRLRILVLSGKLPRATQYINLAKNLVHRLIILGAHTATFYYIFISIFAKMRLFRVTGSAPISLYYTEYSKSLGCYGSARISPRGERLSAALAKARRRLLESCKMVAPHWKRQSRSAPLVGCPGDQSVAKSRQRRMTPPASPGNHLHGVPQSIVRPGIRPTVRPAARHSSRRCWSARRGSWRCSRVRRPASRVRTRRPRGSGASAG